VDSNLSLSLKEAVTTTKTCQSSPQGCTESFKARHESNETLVPHRPNGARDKTHLQVSLAVDDGKQLTQQQLTWPSSSSSVLIFRTIFCYQSTKHEVK
jgi:hypothetical protein